MSDVCQANKGQKWCLEETALGNLVPGDFEIYHNYYGDVTEIQLVISVERECGDKVRVKLFRVYKEDCETLSGHSQIITWHDTCYAKIKIVKHL